MRKIKYSLLIFLVVFKFHILLMVQDLLSLVLVSLNKLISSTDPSTLIKLFIIPVKVISPPVVLAKIVVGLNNFNN